MNARPIGRPECKAVAMMSGGMREGSALLGSIKVGIIHLYIM